MRHSDGSVRLVYFGISFFVPEEETEITVEDVGTPAYRAPELASQATYDPFAADVWSLGVCLYCTLFGELPFLANTLHEQQHLVATAELTFPPDANQDAVDLISKMMMKDPMDRIALEDIWAHPYLVKSQSSRRLGTKSDSLIFKSLSSSDRQNSITRVSRGSMRGSRGQKSSGAKPKPKGKVGKSLLRP
jgi:serine/threonine protein kinase